MDTIKPSRMILLSWVLRRNPLLLHGSHSLHLQMCGTRLTLHYPSRTPTTRDQDMAQAEVISSMPNLRSLSIMLGIIFHVLYPNSFLAQLPGQMGFSRTLGALSQAFSLRQLCLGVQPTSHEDSLVFLLLDLFVTVGERLEDLSLRQNVLSRFLCLFNGTLPNGDPNRIPTFGNLAHLSLDLHCLTDSEYSQLSIVLSHHLPKLMTLECKDIEPGYGRRADGKKPTPVTRNPIQSLVIRECSSIWEWVVSIPARAIELQFHESRTGAIIPTLTELVKSHAGGFGTGCVAKVVLRIDTSPVINDLSTLSITAWQPAAGLTGSTPEFATHLLKDACTTNKVTLITFRSFGSGRL